MAGNVEYSERRLRWAAYQLLRGGMVESHEDLARRLFKLDMECYRHLGRSLTGATYVKGRPK